MTGADIVRVARTYIGVRYRHQGRTREGVDCIGLPALVCRDLGMVGYDASAYAKVSEGSEMLDFCASNLRTVCRADLAPGDILVQTNGHARHMAIVADYPQGGLSIIHAWITNKRVVEVRLDDNFMQTVRGCFRFAEVVE